ncbi:MAG: IS110 family transposase [Aridibacter sp.]
MNRYIGVDLHTTQITVCYLAEKDEISIRKYQLCEIEKFVAGLKKTDEIAVEATGNTRWFCEQLTCPGIKVRIVNPRAFEVIKSSAKKTDEHDAMNLAKFLKANLLPEVRRKSQAAEVVQRMNETRMKFVRMQTSLKNKLHALAVSRGWKLKKESLSSEKGLNRLGEMEWTEMEQIEIEIIIEQMRSLKKSIKRLEKAIEPIAKELSGYENLLTITGIGSRSAGVLLAIIGDIKDFASKDKLASYFGIVPRVKNSADTIKHGRITKLGSKTGRTTLVQCSLVAMRRSPYLKEYYERIKKRRGHGKAKIALARKFLGIIYDTLNNEWVFEDFNNFVLAE